MFSKEFQNDIYKGIFRKVEIFNLNLDTEFKIIGINASKHLIGKVFQIFQN